VANLLGKCCRAIFLLNEDPVCLWSIFENVFEGIVKLFGDVACLVLVAILGFGGKCCLLG